MGYIASYFALRAINIAIEGLDDKQLHTDKLCSLIRVKTVDELAQKGMISDSVFFDMLEYIESMYGEGYRIAVQVGSTMGCNDYGAFGLAFKTARDLYGSFQRVERYGKVVTNVANYSVELGEESAFMALREDVTNRRGLLLTNELAISAGTALCREVSKVPFDPVQVHFSHEAPASSSFHEQYFKCPVHFNSAKNGFEISNELLRAGNNLGDQAVSEFFDSHLETELSEIVDDSRIDQRVVQQIRQSLSEGVPSVAEIASRLNMSGRTLQRRLADEGKVFQDLIDETRKDLSIRLLENNTYSLAEIAFLTGYSEQSTFTRAFKRWYGKTPTDFKTKL